VRQTNYIHQRPVIAGRYSGREAEWKTMDLLTKAAVSISDGDMIDSMIHGCVARVARCPLEACPG
jgi:replication factor C subunit 1